jgi:hypothetical protein
MVRSDVFNALQNRNHKFIFAIYWTEADSGSATAAPTTIAGAGGRV